MSGHITVTRRGVQEGDRCSNPDCFYRNVDIPRGWGDVIVIQGTAAVGRVTHIGETPPQTRTYCCDECYEDEEVGD